MIKPKIKKSMSLMSWIMLGKAVKEFKESRTRVLQLCGNIPKSVYSQKQFYLDKNISDFCVLLEDRFSREYPEFFESGNHACNVFYGRPGDHANWQKINADFISEAAKGILVRGNVGNSEKNNQPAIKPIAKLIKCNGD